MRSGPHRFMYLNTWSPVDGALVEGYRNSGGIALLEKAFPWVGDRLGGFMASYHSLFSLCVTMWSVSFLPLPPCHALLLHGGLYLSGAEINSLLLKLSWLWFSITASEKVTNTGLTAGTNDGFLGLGLIFALQVLSAETSPRLERVVVHYLAPQRASCFLPHGM